MDGRKREEIGEGRVVGTKIADTWERKRRFDLLVERFESECARPLALNSFAIETTRAFRVKETAKGPEARGVSCEMGHRAGTVGCVRGEGRLDTRPDVLGEVTGVVDVGVFAELPRSETARDAMIDNKTSSPVSVKARRRVPRKREGKLTLVRRSLRDEASL